MRSCKSARLSGIWYRTYLVASVACASLRLFSTQCAVRQSHTLYLFKELAGFAVLFTFDHCESRLQCEYAASSKNHLELLLLNSMRAQFNHVANDSLEIAIFLKTRKKSYLFPREILQQRRNVQMDFTYRAENLVKSTICGFNLSDYYELAVE